MENTAMNKRQAMTLEAMQAQEGSASAVRSPDAEEEQSDANEEHNAELERVSAFIFDYAGEQEAAAKASSGVALKPPESPFHVPRGTNVPASKKMQLVILNTAEKTVEVSGFEAFLKMQHGKDPLFRFLRSDHNLHSYYLMAKNHVQQAVQKGQRTKGACASAQPKPPASTSSSNRKAVDPEVQEIVDLLGVLGT